MTPRMISVIGRQNSGKTRLIMKLVERLREQNVSVAVLKHDGHADERLSNDWQKTGSDTSLCLKNGASMTMVVGGGQSLVQFANERCGDNPIELCKKMSSMAISQGFPIDIILVEGYKNSSLPKVVVARTDEDIMWLRENEYSDVVCVVMSRSIEKVGEMSWQVLYDEDIESIYQFLFGKGARVFSTH